MKTIVFLCATIALTATTLPQLDAVLAPGSEKNQSRWHVKTAYGVHPSQQIVFNSLSIAERWPVLIHIKGDNWLENSGAQYGSVPQMAMRSGLITANIGWSGIEGRSWREHMAEIATAIQTARECAIEFGGDPDRLILMGTGCGAHMAALLMTSPDFLEQANLSPENIDRLVLVHPSMLSVPKSIGSASTDDRRSELHDLFGISKNEQVLASPEYLVQDQTAFPPTLVIEMHDSSQTSECSEVFCEHIRRIGGDAERVTFEVENITDTINQLGTPFNEVSEAVSEFLTEYTGYTLDSQSTALRQNRRRRDF